MTLTLASKSDLSYRPTVARPSWDVACLKEADDITMLVQQVIAAAIMAGMVEEEGTMATTEVSLSQTHLIFSFFAGRLRKLSSLIWSHVPLHLIARLLLYIQLASGASVIFLRLRILTAQR